MLREAVQAHALLTWQTRSLGRDNEAGKLRIEGKEYVVQDGDVIEFRFNV